MPPASAALLGPFVLEINPVLLPEAGADSSTYTAALRPVQGPAELKITAPGYTRPLRHRQHPPHHLGPVIGPKALRQVVFTS